MIPTEGLDRFDYVRDLLGQPEALARTLRVLEAAPVPGQLAEEFSAGRFQRVVLTGMGASYHALHPLHLRLTALGVTSLRVDTSELIHCMPALLEPGSLPIVVSQSGRSAETLRLVELVEGRLPVVAVTNTPSSPLARSAAFAVITQAAEKSPVSSQTYTCSLAALEWLGAAMARADQPALLAALNRTVADVSEYLAGWKAHVDSLRGFLEGVTDVFLVGRGRSLAAANEGGLLLKESAHFPAEGIGCAAFRHGPLDMAGPGVLVCVFAGDPRTAPLNRGLVADVVRGGGRVAWIGEDADQDAFRIPDRSPEGRSILEILPIQMISLALAARSGHAPGIFARLAKVTTVE